MKTVRFEVVVAIDDAQLMAEAARVGLPLERAREAIIADVENRLVDSVRYRHAVGRVGVMLTNDIKPV